jgi:hypothetical protein
MGQYIMAALRKWKTLDTDWKTMYVIMKNSMKAWLGMTWTI